MERRGLPPKSYEFSRRALLGLGFLVLTGCASKNESGPKNIDQQQSTEPKKVDTDKAEPRDPSRLASDNEIVRGLGELERICNCHLFDGAMEFFAAPGTKSELEDVISWHPDSLAQLNQAKLQPTIVLEPGEGLGFDAMGDWPLDAYFSAMRNRGVTDQQWGRVVVAPEFIVGEWKGNDPKNFGPSVKFITDKLHQHFPSAQASILIDTDPNEMSALLPLLEQDPERLASFGMESVGIQAFANAARIPFDTNGKANVSGFLNADIVQRIATATGSNKIWINTGLTKEDVHLGVSYTPVQRTAIAHAIGDVIEEVQRRGVQVEELAVFAENKIQDEGRDFSFPPGHEPALIALANRMKDLDVRLSGFAVAPPK